MQSLIATDDGYLETMKLAPLLPKEGRGVLDGYADAATNGPGLSSS
ncbi:MAG: hypothetical protein ABSF46_12970 [Terriglobia bacterium]|jgi:hypothetical protein